MHHFLSYGVSAGFPFPHGEHRDEHLALAWGIRR